MKFPFSDSIAAARIGLMTMIVLILGCGVVGLSSAAATSVSLLPTSNKASAVGKTTIQVLGQATPAWICDGRTGPLAFKSETPAPLPPGEPVYLAVSYLDQGYGKLKVRFTASGRQSVAPDRFLALTLADTGKLVTARMRFAHIQAGGGSNWSFRIVLEGSTGQTLAIHQVSLQDTPFDDPTFKLLISDPWKGPYRGPGVRAAENTTLKAKVMAGYQGWFRTPNDLEARGWAHWGNIQQGTFGIDMWPETSQYTPSVLEKAADVKLKSGKQAYLFSSTWPAVTDTHFRWMREYNIDGVFLQRFVSDRFHSISGGPEWVLANVRAAANREGRIWAIEYDISGYPDGKLLKTLETDWKWLVDEFRLLDDPNYAREGGKPVVFIWGLPFPNRNISPETSNAVVDFFTNDPKYGGNHVIGGIPSNWRTMDAAWQTHFQKYQTVLTWMPSSYANDAADFKKMGINYYPHVKPGFSWANLKHLPSGDDSTAYTARDGGQFYWKQLSEAAKAGGDRLFVGMFDEYDEGTAIAPMSDDSPLTPVRPGVGATFSNGGHPAERGDFVLLPAAELALGETAPSKMTHSSNFFARLGGRITFPSAGDFTFSVEGAVGDDVELFLNGNQVLKAENLQHPIATATQAVTVKKGDSMAFRLECRHRTGKGTLRLLGQMPGTPRQPVPASALQDAWGRFITNEGKPPNWWLQLTRMGKEMILRKRKSDFPHAL